MMNLINLLVVPLLGISLSCPRLIDGNSFSEVQSDSPSSLRVTLEKFSKTRNQVTNAAAKDEARDLIKKSFQDFGLHVWSEKVAIPSSKDISGENIVGMLKAGNTNSSADKIVIVGAHYDTTKNTPGVDDNGSGVTALLEAAKQIARAGCELSNTIMFVAFDYEEDDYKCGYDGLLGSKKFVQNLTSYLQQTGGTVNGAFILESLINYNSSADSQTLPNGLEFVMKDTFEEVKNDSFRGNFIAVVGRRESDKKLLSLVGKYYQNDSNYRAQLAPIPVTGRPHQSPNGKHFRDFYRSDHFRFWNNSVSFSALMLTDTTEFRGYMENCYHRACDDLLHVQDNDLEFLRRTINAVIQSVLDLSGANSCDDDNNVASAIEVKLPLLIIMAFTSCAFITVR